MIPPIATVAKGRCTLAPVPTLSAIGETPDDATNPIINMGCNRVIAPV